jgi:hypothetical protein
MSGEADIRALIEKRRGRAIKAILRVKEARADPHLPPPVADELRRVVLEELNDLTEVVLTVFASLEQRLDDGAVYNQLWLERLEALHAAVVGEDDPVAKAS